MPLNLIQHVVETFISYLSIVSIDLLENILYSFLESLFEGGDLRNKLIHFFFFGLEFIFQLFYFRFEFILIVFGCLTDSFS